MQNHCKGYDGNSCNHCNTVRYLFHSSWQNSSWLTIFPKKVTEYSELLSHFSSHARMKTNKKEK